MKTSFILFACIGIIVIFGGVYFYSNWLSFLNSNSKFQGNLENIGKVIVSVSEHISKDEISYRNINVEIMEQKSAIISLVKEEKIEIPFLGLYETDFEEKHWLVQLYTKNHSDMYLIYIDGNKIFDKKALNSNFYKYLSNEFN